MTGIALTAMSLVSAMGRGLAETATSLHERRSGLAPSDFPHESGPGYIGRVAGVENWAIDPALAPYDCRNNRLVDMAVATDGFEAAVARAAADYGARRVGIFLGTSTSGIEQTEAAYRARIDGALPASFRYRETHDLHSAARFLRERLGLLGPAQVISTACSSSASAFAMAARFLRAGLVDAAIAGGADSLCLTTLRGFRALEVVSPERCRPCAADRTGISLGEAAGLVLLERAGGADQLQLLGAGISADAHHMSAPHPEGVGARLAMRRALDQAGLAAADIDYVNFHGTGTRQNDAVEDAAIAAEFGREVPSSSTKAWSGHTLGSAGVVEAIICAIAIRDGFVPGCLGITAVDPSFQSNVRVTNEARPVRRALSNSFGFGGNNVSLVIGYPT